MITKVRKWGNSLGLRIPKHVAKDLSLAEGTSVDVKAHNGRVVVTPVRDKQYTLNELLRCVTRSNIHDEVEFGKPVGRETW